MRLRQNDCRRSGPGKHGQEADKKCRITYKEDCPSKGSPLIIRGEKIQKRSIGKEDSRTDGKNFETKETSEKDCTISSYTEAGFWYNQQIGCSIVCSFLSTFALEMFTFNQLKVYMDVLRYSKN